MMTTRDVAQYLRVKERKVYELIAVGEIPCTRVTGKWLFPRRLVDLWLLRHTEGAVAAAPKPAPAIVAGSQDPLLEWALQASGSQLAMLAGGSMAGLQCLAEGRAVAAALHLIGEPGAEYNVDAARRALGDREFVLLQWGWRQQGLVVAPGNPLNIRDVSDLGRESVRIARRQEGAGSAVLLERLLSDAGMSSAALCYAEGDAGGETELAFAILEGQADVGLAIEAVARRLRLDFVPLWRERFDLAVGRRDYFEPPLQRLFEFVRDEQFRKRAVELGGYDVSACGNVVYNGA